MMTPRHRWGVYLLSAVFTASSPVSWAAEVQTGFVGRTYRDQTGDHKYVVFVPHDYTPERPWPVILFLHAAGERGNDGSRQTLVGLGPAIRAREKDFPFIAVFPQCEDRTGSIRQAWWPEFPDGKRALEILAEVEQSYRTDKERMYLTGVSMGGFGTWAQAAADPGRWAAVVPISGGADPAWAAKIAQLPVWCFHGSEDRVVLAKESREIIDALRRGGDSPRYTEYPEVGHDAWQRAYANNELYHWLLQHRRGAGTIPVGAQVTPPADALPTLPGEEAPFVPALEIPGAMFLRLGNDLLEALGDSLPHVIPTESLSGTLPDAQQTTSAEGMTFTVRLQQLSYQAKLNRATIEARDNQLVTFTLGVRAELRIGRTDIRGSGRSATCGPLRIILGHRNDLGVAFDVGLAIEGRRVRLKLLDTRFRLPRDNWYVGTPEWVSAQGLGMTRERVASGLRDGLYNDPGRIEREVVASIPRVLEGIEERLNFEQIDRIVAGLWPLPVYTPRVKTWPSAVRVDGDGMTVALGLSVAALNEQQAAGGLKRVELGGADIAELSTAKQFQFGLAPRIMEPLSKEMIEVGAARVLVLDVPMKQLAALAAVQTLAEIIPDLKRRDDREVRAEFLLQRPIRMTPVGDSESALALELPSTLCSIQVHPQPESTQWVPYAEVTFGIRNVARPQVSTSSPGGPILSLEWQGEADIDVSARFVTGYTPSDPRIDTDRIRNILAAGWKEWTELGPLAKVRLEDLNLGFAKLRAERAGWQYGYLTTTFGPAGVLLRNLTAAPVAYEMKGPYSEWGGPYTVEPAKDHRYAVAYPVICRFRSGEGEKQYTLAPGEAFEFEAGTDDEVDLYSSRPESSEQTKTVSGEPAGT